MEDFRREETYRIFVTDCLRLAPHLKCNISYRDLINKKSDNRTGDQIAIDVIKNAGLSFA